MDPATQAQITEMQSIIDRLSMERQAQANNFVGLLEQIRDLTRQVEALTAALAEARRA